VGDQGIDRRIIVRWIIKKWFKVVDWIQVAQDRV
jgi:hypothetical protein